MSSGQGGASSKRLGPKPRTVAERFWSHVRKTDGDGCWEWTGARHSWGYGNAWIGRKPGVRQSIIRELAHRLSWELTHGPIPPGLFVCHRCDNPPCVRPEHLFIGTATDNHVDMTMKQRHSKIPRERWPDIRTEYLAGGASYEDLARKHGVTKSAIFRIMKAQALRGRATTGTH